jgi:outer membrane protein W/uncharacterized protein YbbK (DUF523 family)
MTKLFKVFIISFFFISISTAQTYTDDLNPFSNSFTLTLEGGTTISKTDYNNSLHAPVGKFSMDYLFSTNSRIALGIKLFAGIGNVKADGGADTSVHNIAMSIQTPLHFIGIGPELSFSLGKFCPYVFAGLSYLHFDPEDSSGAALPRNKAGVYSKNQINYNFEFGVKYLLSRHFSINAAVTGHVSTNDYLDDLPNKISTGYHDDQFYTVTVGISYSFLSSSSSAKQQGIEQVHEQEQEQEHIKEQVQVKDQDQDGIPDSLDHCPGTPTGVTVGANGCPLDSDHDGVPDYLDKCPETKAGVKVDSNGCEIVVKKKEVKPIDSDKDGIPDFLDKCPNTPYGVVVDSTGCPLDSDHDGVPDFLDKCPETKAGVKVDSNGCEIIEKKAEKKTEKLTPSNAIKSPAKIKAPETTANTIAGKVTYNYDNDLIVTGNIFSDGKLYVIQLGSWINGIKANKQLTDLKAKGYNAFIYKVQIGNGYRYRVRVGYFKSQAEAQAFYNKNFAN